MANIIPSRSEKLNTPTLQLRKDSLARMYLDKETTSKTVAVTTSNNIVGCGLANMFSPRPSLLSYDECVAALGNYLETTASRDVKPTISGMCLSLGMSRTNFLETCETGQYYDVVSGTTIVLPSPVWDLLRNIRDNYVSMIEGFMEAGIVHPAVGIFLLKNNGEYKEVVEKRYTINKTTVDATALAEKYKQELEGL